MKNILRIHTQKQVGKKFLPACFYVYIYSYIFYISSLPFSPRPHI